MKRPFAVIGFTWLFVLIAASYCGYGMSVALAVFCCVCAAVILLCVKPEKRLLPAVIFFAAAAAFASFSFAEYFRYAPAQAMDGTTAEISGIIEEAPTESYGNCYYIVKTDSITASGKKYALKLKIRVRVKSELDAEPFDRITTKAKLYLPSAENLTGYDSRSYYKSKGIYLFASVYGSVSVKQISSKPPYYYAIKLRQYISGVIDRFVGGERGGLAAGILIGDTSNISDTVKNDFSDCGISHILAVSGTQTSLIMEYLMLLLCALKIPRRPAAAVTSAAIVIFMAVTGFSPSVSRAGIMSLMCLCAILIKRDADVLNSLGLSAFLLCLTNPYAARDVGLLLSFFATLGMITVSKRMYKYFGKKNAVMPEPVRKAAKVPLGVLCETIGASVLTYPIIILVFGRVSLVSLAANIFEVPVSLFVTLATAVIAIFSPAWFLIFLIKPTAILIRAGCAFMIWFAHVLASMPLATVSAEYGFVNILIIFAAVLFVIMIVFKGKGANPAVCVTCLCLSAAVGIFSYSVAQHGVMSVTPIENTGSAIVTSNGHAVLIDLPESLYNPGDTVETLLRSRNIMSLDAVILTSPDDDELNTLSEIKKNINITHVYVPNASDCETDNVSTEKISAASKLPAPYGVTITILPDKSQSGLLTLVSCAGSSAVITGTGKTGDYSQYNFGSLKVNLMVSGDSLSSGLISKFSPQNIVCSGTCLNSSVQYLSSASSVNTQKCSYLTRGGGSYKILYY